VAGFLLPKPERKTDMKTEIEKKMMAFAVPTVVATAAEVAAQQDLSSVSHVLRQALVRDLRERGLLPERTVAA
jgi:hypothetical protein